MNKWEIWDYPFPSQGDPHPVVIISPRAWCKKPGVLNINALSCRSLRGEAMARPYEVILNGSDGLDGRTLVDCSVIHLFKKDGFIGTEPRGTVCAARRREIIRIIYSLLAE